MNTLEQIQQGIDFIEENLDYDLNLKQIANETGISQWHFQRMFKALTTETLKTYIRSRRLSNAMEKLLTTQQRIIEISITAGFESQESFSRAFKKTFDMTPNQARKIGNKNLFLKKIEFTPEYLAHINQSISLRPEIIYQPKTIFVGLKTCFYGTDSEKNNIAEKLPALWDSFLLRMGEIKDNIQDIGYGIIQQTPKKTDQLEYYAALEVTESSAIPKGMTRIEVPASTYARFSHIGHVKNLDNTVNYIYSSWLMQSAKRHSYGPDIEIYGEGYIPDSEDSVIHYAIPVKG